METIEKRRPGRPRKNKPKKQIDKQGILEKPSNWDDNNTSVHAVEIVHDNPVAFKKIFALFHSYMVNPIEAHFQPTQIVLSGRSNRTNNKQQSSRIKVVINGDKMVRYWVESEFKVSLCLDRFNSVMSSINKQHSQIILVTTRNNKLSKLWVSFLDENDINQSNNTIEVNSQIMPGSEDVIKKINSDLETESIYPLSFKITSTCLKSKIGEYSKAHAMKFDIRTDDSTKIGDTVEFSTTSADGGITKSCRLGCISKYDYNGYFIAPICKSVIQPLANSLITDSYNISVHESKDLIITAKIYDEDEKDKQNGKEQISIYILLDLFYSNDNPSI